MIFKGLFILLLVAQGLLCQQDSKSSYIMKSLLLPGWGNYELKGNTSGFIHIAGEASMWIGYLYYSDRANHLKSNYKRFAKRNLNLKGSYSFSYYKRLAIYKSFDSYIEFQQRRGVDIEQINFNLDPWRWESDELQTKYSDIREDAIETDRLPALFLYGMIFNRLVSIFTTSYNYNQIESNLSMHKDRFEFMLSYQF